MSEENALVYSNAEEAYEGYQDVKAGLSPVDGAASREIEPGEVYANEREALHALQERRLDIAEAQEFAKSLKKSPIKPQAATPETRVEWTADEVQAVNTVTQDEQALTKELVEFRQTYGGVDLNALRQSDPARFAQIHTDDRNLTKRIQAHNERKATVGAHVQQKALLVARENEMRKLTAVIPQLASEEAKKTLADWALRKGYNHEDVYGCMDHKVIIGAWNAMQAEAPKSAKKKPVFSKTKRKKSTKRSRSKYRKAQQRLRQTGSIDDALNLLKVAKRARQ